MVYRGLPTLQRLEAYSMPEPNSGCWIWLRALDGRGYGQFGTSTGNKRAHRVSYEAHRGPIPAGLVIDHLCHTPACINPDHLEPVTYRENTRRAFTRDYMHQNRFKRGPGAKTNNPMNTHCCNGHERNEANTYVSPRGQRTCRPCNLVSVLKYEKKQRSVT